MQHNVLIKSIIEESKSNYANYTIMHWGNYFILVVKSNNFEKKYILIYVIRTKVLYNSAIH